MRKKRRVSHPSWENFNLLKVVNSIRIACGAPLVISRGSRSPAETTATGHSITGCVVMNWQGAPRTGLE